MQEPHHSHEMYGNAKENATKTILPLCCIESNTYKDNVSPEIRTSPYQARSEGTQGPHHILKMYGNAKENNTETMQ